MNFYHYLPCAHLGIPQGACVVALGEHAAGLFSTSDRLEQRLRTLGMAAEGRIVFGTSLLLMLLLFAYCIAVYLIAPLSFSVYLCSHPTFHCSPLLSPLPPHAILVQVRRCTSACGRCPCCRSTATSSRARTPTSTAPVGSRWEGLAAEMVAYFYRGYSFANLWSKT